MKKNYFWIIGMIIIILLLIVFRGREDSWNKDNKGVYLESGSSAIIPQKVDSQREAINCALDLYKKNYDEGLNFSSQCLGSCGDYAVDIVHVPRIEEDNLVENQCNDFIEGKVKNFIELDKHGGIVRIVD